MNVTVTAYEAILRHNPDISGPPLETPRRGHAPSEHEEQCAVVAWAAENAGRWPALHWLFHVPNGGDRPAEAAALLKQAGVRAGVPDLFLPCARGGFYGLFLELKRRDRSNGPTAEQGVWLSALRSAGYRAEVCYGAQAAIATLIEYLEGEAP